MCDFWAMGERRSARWLANSGCVPGKEGLRSGVRSFSGVRWLMSLGGLLLLFGCSSPRVPKPLEMEPIGTSRDIPTTPLDDDNDSDVTTPNSGTPSPGTTSCSASEFENLEETLRFCEVPMPRASDVPSVKDKLDVQAVANPPSTTPGGRLEVLVTFRNKSGEPLPLYFTGEPIPRFELEALDARGRRIDLPPGKWPGYPKGFKPEPREAKAAKVTLEKNGVARVKLGWDAVKMKWAPDKAKVWEGSGYPRVPSGSLSKGKYVLRLVLPILGEIEAVKIPVEVSNS